MSVTLIEINMKARTTICIMAGITTNKTNGSNFILRKKSFWLHSIASSGVAFLTCVFNYIFLDTDKSILLYIFII